MIPDSGIEQYGVIDGRFKPIGALGSGAGGDVLLVRDTHLDGHLLALKILHPHHVLSEAAFGRFRIETRVTMQLSHPNILATYGMGRTAEGLTYLKMEYVEGRPLDQVIRSAEYSGDIDAVVAQLRGVASALRYAHSRGIIHRDLKPANILIAADGSVKVADFGLAYLIRAEARYTRSGDIVGTPHYMAPEVLRGEIPDARSDIYALGMVAYELVTGRPAFDAESFWELAHHIINTAPPVICPLHQRTIPTWLETFILCALQKDKHQRFGDMSMVLQALQVEENGSDNDVKKPVSEETVASRGTLSTEVLTHRTQQYAPRLLNMLLLIGVMCMAFLPPWVNEDARQKYGVAIFFLERIALSHSPLLRRVFHVDQDLTWPEIALGVNSTERMAMAFLYAGYSPETYSENSGEYPVHGATRRSHSDLLRGLLSRGASPDRVDREGNTPLAVAVNLNFPEGVAILLESGASAAIADHSGRLPLHTAARRGREAIVTELLRAGSPVNRSDLEGRSPLHVAMVAGNLEVVALLLAYGADPDARDVRGATPLDLLDRSDPRAPQFRLLLSAPSIVPAVHSQLPPAIAKLFL